MATVADKLRAEGIPLELGDRWVAIKFTNRAKAEVEKRFGSCLAFETQLNQALSNHVGGPLVSVCLGALAATLVGPAGKWTEELIDAAMNPEHYGKYLEAILEAWSQAWPATKEGDGQGNAEGTTESISPGIDTSGSPSSTSASAPMNSGA